MLINFVRIDDPPMYGTREFTCTIEAYVYREVNDLGTYSAIRRLDGSEVVDTLKGYVSDNGKEAIRLMSSLCRIPPNKFESTVIVIRDNTNLESPRIKLEDLSAEKF